MCLHFDPEKSIAALYLYQPPGDFLAEVEKFKSVPDERFINDPRYQKAKEAWIAGRCARSLDTPESPVQLRLIPDIQRFPDCQLQFRAQEHEFEVVSVMKPGRKMGDEHKKRLLEKYLLSPYQPGLGETDGPSWVAEAIHRKAEKRYGAQPHLLIYANFEANSLDLRRVATAAGDSLDQFSSVWVLWESQLGKVHDGGTFPHQATFVWLPAG